ncbi:DUF885 family protein [Streptomyces sp. NPDC004393]|uniref:DUF885 family protein n=1 Tax=Streptomyces sp. NPDC004533 TaxID=3154278 RepID=UPI0033ADF71B
MSTASCVSNRLSVPIWARPAAPGTCRTISPAGAQARAALARTALRQLAKAEIQPGGDADGERCRARLLRERLTAELAIDDAQEHLRAVSNLRSPVHNVRDVFTLIPAETPDHYADIAARLRAAPAALEGYRALLTEGLPAGPRQVDAGIGQITHWLGGGVRSSWFQGLVDGGPQTLREELDTAAAKATGAYAALRDWFRETYGPAVAGSADIAVVNATRDGSGTGTNATRPRRCLRLRLVGVLPAGGGNGRRGRQDSPRRESMAGAAVSPGARTRDRRRGRGAHLAAEADGPGDGGPRRHALRAAVVISTGLAEWMWRMCCTR